MTRLTAFASDEIGSNPQFIAETYRTELLLSDISYYHVIIIHGISIELTVITQVMWYLEHTRSPNINVAYH